MGYKRNTFSVKQDTALLGYSYFTWMVFKVRHLGEINSVVFGIQLHIYFQLLWQWFAFIHNQIYYPYPQPCTHTLALNSHLVLANDWVRISPLESTNRKKYVYPTHLSFILTSSFFFPTCTTFIFSVFISLKAFTGSPRSRLGLLSVMLTSFRRYQCPVLNNIITSLYCFPCMLPL